MSSEESARELCRVVLGELLPRENLPKKRETAEGA